MNSTAFEELFVEKAKAINEKIANTEINAVLKIYYENSKKFPCDKDSADCQYINGDIIFLKNGMDETDAFTFGICLMINKKSGELIYPSSKNKYADTDYELSDLFENIDAYADKLSAAEDAARVLNDDIEASRAAIEEYEARIKAMKKKTMIGFGIAAAAILTAIILSIAL